MTIFVGMKKMHIIYFFLLLILSAGCKKKKTDIAVAGNKVDTIAVIQPDQLNDRDLVALSAEAEEEVSKWLEYITATAEVKRLQEAKVSQISGIIETLLLIAEELERSVPKRFERLPVESRILVFVTKINVLNAAVNERKPDQEKIRVNAAEVVSAFDHLTIQLNETFLTSIDAFEIELDKDAEKNLLDEMPEELLPNQQKPSVLEPKKENQKELLLRESIERRKKND
ncbi:hypothetical protein GCM10009117_07060 [Gangjinia marincola]|uniref:Lipoprotein n=1 Tax=Gangjinia marincola TaxID=578463 RepID=A0ABN1MFJ8_9FLAO